MSDFARKAVQWNKFDLQAAAAVLRKHSWSVEAASKATGVVRAMPLDSPEPLTEEEILLCLLDCDFSAAESLLIFVHEFRCLIEGADSPTEGTHDVDAVEEAL